MRQFDAFFSYNSEDVSLIRKIAEELQESGIKVWFDEWELPNGKELLDALDEGIKNSRSIVVFIGPSGLSPWQNEEVKTALEGNVTPSSSVIPVILHGVKKESPLPAFLKKFPNLDCRKTQTAQIDMDKLIKAITKRKPKRVIPQIGGEFIFNIKKSGKTERLIRVYTLPNPNKTELLNLTWETFGLGIENLRKQIWSYEDDLSINACFGINDAGLVMATFLNASVMKQVKIGYIKSERSPAGAIIIKDSSFPKLQKNPTLMLMDFEAKSGGSLKKVVQMIREKYIEPNIYVSVFGALTDKAELKIQSHDELAFTANLSQLGIKDFFIACTVHRPGIEPPLRLR